MIHTCSIVRQNRSKHVGSKFLKSGVLCMLLDDGLEAFGTLLVASRLSRTLPWKEHLFYSHATLLNAAASSKSHSHGHKRSERTHDN